MISIGTANEKGTCVISCAFTDENNTAIVPKTFMWTLTDSMNNVINNREQVEVTNLDSSINIVLSGDDLAVLSYEHDPWVKRFFICEATYDSSFGDDLPLKDQTHFNIENFKYIKFV